MYTNQNINCKVNCFELGEIIYTKNDHGVISNSANRVICVFDELKDELYDPANGIFKFGDLSSIPKPTGSNFDLYDSYSDTNNIPQMTSDQISKYNAFVSNKNQYPDGSMFLFSYIVTQSNYDAIISEFTNQVSILEMAKNANNYFFKCSFNIINIF